MHPLAVKNKLAILGGIVLLVLTTSCGESTSSTSSSSNQPTSNYTPETTQQVEPSSSEISNENPFGECPYNISDVQEILTRKSNAVSDRFTGNVPLNADLSVAIAIAQKVVEDPRCTQTAEIAQLPQLISASQQVLRIGQGRVNTTMQQAVDLQESANRFLFPRTDD